jgi:hypothetical protein
VAQHDYIIANQSGAAFRADLNNGLAAIVSNNSGAAQPSTTYAYQWWADTTAGLLKLRNSANNAWITLRELDGTLLMEDGTAAAPGLSFASDPDTGIFRAGANEFGIATNGVERVEFGTTEVVFNDGGANYDFRIEGDTNSSLFFVDASAEAVGIGTATPGAILHTVNTSAGAATVGAFIQNSSLTAGTEVRLGFAPNTNVVGDNRYSWIGAVNGTGSNDSSLTFATTPGGTSATERMRIDSSGRLLVGTSTARSVGGAAIWGHYVEGTGTPFGASALINNNNDNFGPVLVFGKSRGTTVGSNTIVVNGDIIGDIRFCGADGVTLNSYGGQIKCEVDGTPGSGDMPGRLVFSTTADGAASPTERMRITSTGITRTFGATSVHVIQSASTAGTTNAFLNCVYSSTDNLASGGTTSFLVYTNGNVQNTNNSYGAISDLKLKENIVDANSQWNDLKALQVRKYNFKEGQTHTQIGLVAQEVELISPGLVFESPDRDEEGNDLGTVTKSVNYSVLYMKAVKALQEAMERIEVLEQRLTDAGIA